MPTGRLIDHSHRWKAHPPSKRRHMRSWRYASDEQKLAYAPLRGRYTEVPIWARHPHADRKRHVGTAVVEQNVMVYAEDRVTEWAGEVFQRQAEHWSLALIDALDYVAPCPHDCVRPSGHRGTHRAA